jgi:hypothetical protein
MVDWLDAHGKIADSAADPFEDRLIARWQELVGAGGGVA